MDSDCDCLIAAFCGCRALSLPSSGEECKYVLLGDCTLHKWDGEEWIQMTTPNKFFFFDIECHVLLLVNNKCHLITKVCAKTKVLDCIQRKIFQVEKNCWFKICDLSDTESVTRMTIVKGDATQVTITLLGETFTLHESSEFIEEDIMNQSGNQLTLDISNLQSCDTRVFIYILSQEACDSIIRLVNHIIMRLPSTENTLTFNAPLPISLTSTPTYIGKNDIYTNPLLAVSPSPVTGNIVLLSIFVGEITSGSGDASFQVVRVATDGTVTPIGPTIMVTPGSVNTTNVTIPVNTGNLLTIEATATTNITVSSIAITMLLQS